MTWTGLVRHSVLQTPTSHGLPWAALCLIVATAVRLALNPWVEGVPFLTYFPATLLAGLFVGRRMGALVLASSAVVANYAFQPPYWAFALSSTQLVATAGFLVAGVLILMTTDATRRLLIEAEAARRREAALTLELSHRVQNNLAIVQSLAHQTARVNPDPDSFYGAFRDRLIALSAAHGVLVSRSFTTAALPDLAAAALAPFRDPDRISLDGQACIVPAASAVPLVMVLHELATNASKYGALSVDQGRVAVAWSVTGTTCVLTWREVDGPPVAAPSRTGLGSRVLRRQAGLDAVDLRFEPDGVRCEVVIPGVAAAE